jgi:hypothetical protein
MKKAIILFLLMLSALSYSFSKNSKEIILEKKEKPAESGVKMISKNSFTNHLLTVTYDETTKILTTKDNITGKEFIKEGLLVSAGNITGSSDITSRVFGKGKSIKINKADSGYYSLELYPDRPFLVINGAIKNRNNETVDIPSISPARFKLDLGKTVNELKTLGTGGLIEPDKNPGSYVFLTVVDPKTRNGVVAGWLTNEKGSGVILSEVKDNEIILKSQIDYGHFIIPPDKSENLETLMIGYFSDSRLGEELLADAIAKQNKIKMKPRSAVYCTWYSEKNNGAGSERSTMELTDFVKKNLKSFGLETIQIDDLWQGGEKINGPCRGFDRVDPKGGYPNGMSKIAKYIKDAGLKAGIWWLPFARNHTAAEYKDKQKWFAYRDNGKPYETYWGGTSLDLTNPEVLNHVSKFAKNLKGWGYNYFKMDGLWTGTVTEHVYINDGYKNDTMGNCLPLMNRNKTQIEAFRDGLKTLRTAVGSDQFFSGCSISQNMRTFGASMGLVDAMRIGPDNNHDGRGILTGVIRGARLYFLNGRVWWNDPDPVLMREISPNNTDKNVRGVRGNINNAKMLPSWVALTGAFYLSSDWLPDLPKERLEIMKRCMTPHNAISRPVDAFDREIASIWLTTDKRSGVERNVIGIFNWDTIPQRFGSSTVWAGLEKNKTYYAFDFWANKPISDISNSFEYELPARTCKVIALRAKENHPVVVSTSRHVTQGIVDLKREEWKDGVLSATSEVIGGDDYEVRIAGLADSSNWSLKDLKILGDNKNVTIKASPQTENGWLRILISAKKDCIVRWQARFKK